LSGLRDALGGCNQASLELHLEAEIKPVSRCNWRRRLCNSEIHLEAEIKLNSEMHLEAMLEGVQRNTGSP
jgi:hypothetical protein